MRAISEETILKHVIVAESFSDDDYNTLWALALAFVSAHLRAPGRPSLEVGTRAGGSAMLWLLLLRELYGTNPPLLLTVDPYGEKPNAITAGTTYGDVYYQAQKALLSQFANHGHFLLPSDQAFRAFAQKLHTFQHGDEVSLYDFAWVYLDGEHDLGTIQTELGYVLPPGSGEGLLAPGGFVAVDNVTNDAETLPWLQEHYDLQLTPNGLTAVIAGVK